MEKSEKASPDYSVSLVRTFWAVVRTKVPGERDEPSVLRKRLVESRGPRGEQDNVSQV